MAARPLPPHVQRVLAAQGLQAHVANVTTDVQGTLTLLLGEGVSLNAACAAARALGGRASLVSDPFNAARSAVALAVPPARPCCARPPLLFHVLVVALLVALSLAVGHTGCCADQPFAPPPLPDGLFGDYLFPGRP